MYCSYAATETTVKPTWTGLYVYVNDWNPFPSVCCRVALLLLEQYIHMPRLEVFLIKFSLYSRIFFYFVVIHRLFSVNTDHKENIIKLVFSNTTFSIFHRSGIQIQNIRQNGRCCSPVLSHLITSFLEPPKTYSSLRWIFFICPTYIKSRVVILLTFGLFGLQPILEF